MSKTNIKTVKDVLLCFFILLCINISLFGQDKAPAEPVQPQLCINGIIFGEKNSLAVINGDSFEQGEIVEGARIVAITESTVTFEFNGSTFSKGLGEGCDIAKTMSKTFEKTIEQATRQIQSNITLSKPRTVRTRVRFNPKTMTAEMATLGLLLFFTLLAYVYCALTLQLVAKKTQTANGWLAWIPVVNIFLMCMIARRPLWWAVLLLIMPFTIVGILPALIMGVVILMDIAAACSKPKWLVLLIFVPFGLFFFWGYLAFSKTQESTDTPIKHISEAKSEVTKSETAKATESEQLAAPSIEKSEDDKPVSKQPDKTTHKEPPVYNG